MASQATCADGKTAKYSHPCCPSHRDFLGQGNFQMTHNEICPPQTLPKTFFAVPPLERNVMTLPFFPHQKLDRAIHSPNQGLGRVLGQGPVDKSLEKLGLDSVRLQKFALREDVGEGFTRLSKDLGILCLALHSAGPPPGPQAASPTGSLIIKITIT